MSKNLFLHFVLRFVLLVTSSLLLNLALTHESLAAISKKPQKWSPKSSALKYNPHVESMLLIDDILPLQSAMDSLYKTTNGKSEDPLEPKGLEQDKMFSMIEESQRRLQYLYNTGFLGITL